MNRQNSQRKPVYDNIKGLLIFLVVFAHCLYDIQNDITVETIVKIIYLFHMPAFVFVSGFFGKSQRAQGFAPIVQLFFAYLIFNSILGIIMGYSNILIPVYSYWYILSLIMWRMTAKYVSQYKLALPMTVFFAFAVGFVPQIDNTLALSRFFAFYPFYLAGYLLDDEKIIPKNNLKRIKTGLLALTVMAIGIYVGIENLSCPISAMLMDPYYSALFIFFRVSVWSVAFPAIIAIFYLMPNKNIPLLTMAGRNSLSVFLIHRPFTLLFSKLMPWVSSVYIIVAAVVVSVLLCLLFGNDSISTFVTKYLKYGSDVLLSKKCQGKKSSYILVRISIFAVIGALLISSIVDKYSLAPSSSPNEYNSDLIFEAISEEKELQFNNAFKIVFSGDLILLEDQVKRAYKNGTYDFSDMFEYARPYISSADYAIGVFEGPMAGKAVGYSTSNYDDDKELALNFPDEFAAAVKHAGFDLVTTANNHVLDKGIVGAIRTLDILDQIQLDHTGSYRSTEDKENNRVKIVEIDDIKFAILSYTYGINGMNVDESFSGEYSFVTSVVSGTSGPLYKSLKERVMKDFEVAKSHNPDLIIVLPHIGTQFSNELNGEQSTWFDIFKAFGADIILGDHSHSVQPIYISEEQGRKTLEAYSPGNFANIYRENQGDTSALIEVYIDRNSKQIIGGGIVPLYTQARLNTNYRALPIFEIENNATLRSSLSTDDYKRAEDAHSIITGVMLGNELDISGITPSYLFDESGFLRQRPTGLKMTEKYEEGILNQAIQQANSVCFIGDSLTEGTKNGGSPWYEPIYEIYTNKTFLNFATGGCTISYLNNQADNIPQTDLYVIAIGTNDVRYRDDTICAMTPQEFSQEAEKLRTSLQSKNSNARFLWIAPWYSTDGDPFTPLTYQEKLELNEAYSNKLMALSRNHNDSYININGELQEFFSNTPSSDYLLDHIHPNAGRGVLLYLHYVLSAK